MIEAARAEIGTPFVHCAAVSGIGVDCVGLLVVVAREVYGADIRLAPYSRQVNEARLKAELRRYFRLRAPDSAPEPGDVLLLRIRNHPQHVAIYTGPTIIHADIAARRVVEVGFAEPWPSRIEETYEWLQSLSEL